MRMLFEVEDLSVASPATVSRCGMVYVPEENNTWSSYIHSWMQTALFENCNTEAKLCVQELFEEYIPQGVDFVKDQASPESFLFIPLRLVP